MKMLARVVSVLALAAFAAPALPCSDMQTTATQDKVQSPPVAKKDAQKAQQKSDRATTVAKANPQKPAAN
jgi:hypothetical protein